MSVLSVGMSIPNEKLEVELESRRENAYRIAQQVLNELFSESTENKLTFHVET